MNEQANKQHTAHGTRHTGGTLSGLLAKLAAAVGLGFLLLLIWPFALSAQSGKVPTRTPERRTSSRSRQR